MVAVLTLISKPLLQTSGQLLALPTLRLGKTARGLPQFVGVSNLLATRQCEEHAGAWLCFTSRSDAL